MLLNAFIEAPLQCKIKIGSVNKSLAIVSEGCTTLQEIPDTRLEVVCYLEVNMSYCSCAESKDNEVMVMTTASWRMLQWMSHYADLMRLLPPDSGKIYSSCCELFELYFLHVFHCFSDVTVTDLLSGQTMQVVAFLMHFPLKVWKITWFYHIDLTLTACKSHSGIGGLKLLLK